MNKQVGTIGSNTACFVRVDSKWNHRTSGSNKACFVKICFKWKIMTK